MVPFGRLMKGLMALLGVVRGVCLVPKSQLLGKVILPSENVDFEVQTGVCTDGSQVTDQSQSWDEDGIVPDAVTGSSHPVSQRDAVFSLSFLSKSQGTELLLVWMPGTELDHSSLSQHLLAGEVDVRIWTDLHCRFICFPARNQNLWLWAHLLQTCINFRVWWLWHQAHKMHQQRDINSLSAV